jgi:flagellar hook assembly protein FlgD
MRGQAAYIKVGLAQGGQLSVVAYNLAGTRVRQVVDEYCPAGTHIYTWDGRNAQGDVVSTGMYIVLIQGPNVRAETLVGVLK